MGNGYVTETNTWVVEACLLGKDVETPSANLREKKRRWGARGGWRGEAEAEAEGKLENTGFEKWG